MQKAIINEIELGIVEYNGQRVITLKDIDRLHMRSEGTARRNFNSNRKRFASGRDFFMIYRGDTSMFVFRTLEIPPKGLTLLTESGYLMLVKSFTDDLAWKVQRELVNNYFRVNPEPAPALPPPVIPALPEAKREGSPQSAVQRLLEQRAATHEVDKFKEHAAAFALLAKKIDVGLKDEVCLAYLETLRSLQTSMGWHIEAMQKRRRGENTSFSGPKTATA